MRQRDEGKETVVVDERAPRQRQAKPAPLERQGDDEGRERQDDGAEGVPEPGFAEVEGPQAVGDGG